METWCAQSLESKGYIWTYDSSAANRNICSFFYSLALLSYHGAKEENINAQRKEDCEDIMVLFWMSDSKERQKGKRNEGKQDLF